MNHKHGMANSRLYRIWMGMKMRCLNPRSPAFKIYGGRGIAICERWMNFPDFACDMGEPPAGSSLDRINNDKGYSPENCRWATRSEQMRNRSITRMVEVEGVARCVAEWAEINGLSVGTISARLKKGWDPSLAVTAPPVKSRKGIPRGAMVRDYAEKGVRWSEDRRAA